MRYLFAYSIFFANPAFAEELTVKKSADRVEFQFGNETITTYHIGEKVAKPYFWPVNAPGGIAVTRAWPMVKGTAGETTDHVHQKSAWFCHGDVIPVGLALKVRSADKRVEGVDFWSETAGHGKMVCVKVGEVKPISKTQVELPTKNEWRTADGIKILDENRTIRVLKLEAGYLIELQIELLANDYEIHFGDTKEGAMGVRVPDSFRTVLKDGGTITTDGGKTVTSPSGKGANLPIWGQPSDWHDYTGKVSDKTAGITIFDAQSNSHRAMWHTRDYGLMAANPFGRNQSGFPAQKGKTDLVTIKKGESLKLRYAIYAHAGDAKAGKVAEAYGSFNGK